MTQGIIRGTVGIGATETWELREFTGNVAPDSQCRFVITTQYWIAFAGRAAYKVFINGVEVVPGAGFDVNQPITWTPTEAVICDNYTGKYDCINGVCQPSSLFNTEGKYATLSACQAVCSNNGNACNPPNICAPPDYCPPGYVCLTTDEFNQIDGLSVAAKGSACG